MILLALLLWLTVGSLLTWWSGRLGRDWPRWVSLVVTAIPIVGLAAAWARYLAQPGTGAQGPWLLDLPWIPQLGISFSLGVDGVSLLLILLSSFLGLMAVAASWRSIQYRVGFFHFNLLWTLAAIIGVFMATDLDREPLRQHLAEHAGKGRRGTPGADGRRPRHRYQDGHGPDRERLHL
jgi:NADH-quinone oxidoreductase subunit M